MQNQNPAAAHDAPALIEEYEVPILRVFEYTLLDGSTRKFSSHYYDTSTGDLIFLDEAWNGSKRRWYYRKTVADGQWLDVAEVTAGEPSTEIN